MIPTQEQARLMWEKYRVPGYKRTHLKLVADVALVLAEKLKEKGVGVQTGLLTAAALLHDIDKNVEKFSWEQHPDAAVRILKGEGMEEVAGLVRVHPLHAILDPTLTPRTWEEKVLFLADKMVKGAILTVDERFRLWNEEHLPPDQQAILDAAYPKVKALEKDVLGLMGIDPQEVAAVAKKRKKSTIAPAT